MLSLPARSILPGLLNLTVFFENLLPWNYVNSIPCRAALAFTLHWAAALHAKVPIWSDCLGVVNNFISLSRGKARIRPNANNADLWYWVERSLADLGDGAEVRKVAAHQDARKAHSRYDDWLCWNNGAADRAARMANQSRPPEFWALWSKHATESLQVQDWFVETGNLQLAVAEFCTRKGTFSPDDVQPRQKPSPRVFAKFFTAES